MNCPFCQHTETKVIDSREADDGTKIRRRRECLSCEGRFTTRESIELSMPRVVKNDGRQSVFDEDKIRVGLAKALEKRPVNIATIETAVASIASEIYRLGEREISSQQIGEVVMQHLQQIDPVAYVRFASVYRCFKDLSEFDKTIQSLKASKEHVE